uniref:Mitochondrial import inner membrane translocase subunit TIM50 n=1 Tax=Rhizophora mucronata TaxID=61149 RepID=A0A2P2L942_RHIMU
MASCNIEEASCWDKKKGEKSRKRHVAPLDSESVDGTYLMTNTLVERDACLEHEINSGSTLHVTKAQCNEELRCSKTVGEEKKRRQDRKKNAQMVAEGDMFVTNSDSFQRDIGLGPEVDLNPMENLERAQFPELGSSKLQGSAQNSMDFDKVCSVKLLENKLERVEVREHATSTKFADNVSKEKSSDNYQNGTSSGEESKITAEIKNTIGSDLPVNEENDAQQSLFSLERPDLGLTNKKLLVLDVNGILADVVTNASWCSKPDIIVSKKSVFKRPFCDDFLRFCFEKFNVGIWSSRTRRNVSTLVEFLFGDSREKLLFCWDQSHCSNTGFTTVENRDKPLVLKELKKLWEKLEPDLPWKKGDYNKTNTILLDDSPYKALRNPVHLLLSQPSLLTDIYD